VSDRGLQSQIMSDLFVAPITVIPGLTGLAAFTLGFAVKSSTLVLLGLCGFLVTIVGAAWRFRFNMAEVTERASKYIQLQKMVEEHHRLDELDEKLSKDGDSRDEEYLRSLRSVHDAFTKDVEEDNLGAFVTSQMISDINAMFSQCVKLIEFSFDLLTSSKSLTSSIKESVLKDREDILASVEKSVISFTETVNGIRALKLQDRKEEATQMQQLLAKRLEVAQNTQREMRNLGEHTHLSEFVDFQSKAND